MGGAAGSAGANGPPAERIFSRGAAVTAGGAGGPGQGSPREGLVRAASGVYYSCREFGSRTLESLQELSARLSPRGGGGGGDDVANRYVGAAREERVREFRALVTGGGALHEEPSDADLLRFLIARKWDLRKAKRMFDEYQEWRREWPQSRVRPVDVPVSVGHRKAFVLPRPDVRGFPAVVLVASRHMMYEVGKGKGSQETTYAFQVFCFDHAIAHADRLGSQKLTIVLDLEGLGWRNLDLNCLKNIVLLAQARYPERLGACLFYRPPNVFYGLWKAVKPLVDPRTAGKIRFAFNAEELQEELGPPAQVPVLLGGDMPDGEMLPVESIPL